MGCHICNYWTPERGCKHYHGTINIAPTWEGVLPSLLAVLRDGNPEGQALALAELQKMAKVADLAGMAENFGADNIRQLVHWMDNRIEFSNDNKNVLQLINEFKQPEK